MTDATTDRIALQEMLSLYALAVDTIGNNPVSGGDDDPWLESAATQLAGCLMPGGRVFLYFEGPDGPATPAGNGGPVDFAAFVRGYFTEYGYLGTYHLVGNVVVDFKGDDTARVRSYINSTHWMSGDRMLLAPILYVDDAVRDGSLWKIQRREIQVMRFWVTDGYTPDFVNDPTLTRPGPVQETTV